MLDIFRQKTAPAFEVALQLGALYAGVDAHDEVADVLSAYSEALGIAYQIRDDLATSAQRRRRTTSPACGRACCSRRRTSAPAKATRIAKTSPRALWKRHFAGRRDGRRSRSALSRTRSADERCRDLLERYKEEAIRSLRDLENASLKGLLRRVIGKIFNDTEIKGWCKEFEAKNLLGVTGRSAALEGSPIAAAR